MQSSCELEDVNWIAGEAPAGPVALMAKARYRSAEVACRVQRDGSTWRVDFDEPQRAITPGQALVLYDGQYVVGGGTIARRG